MKVAPMQKRFLALLLALSVADVALAADKDPLAYPIRQYVLVLSIALLGGLVSFAAKVKAGSVSAFNVMHLVGELTTSAFAGLMCFWLAEAAGLPQLVTVCLVGVSGHMGARAIAIFEQWAQRRLGVHPGPGEHP